MLSAHLVLLVLVTIMTTTSQQSETTEAAASVLMTLTEAKEMFNQTFHSLDVNHDNLVDITEFMEPFLVHDHDEGLSITLEEFLQQAPEEENREFLTAEFFFHDDNDDGIITVPEMQAEFQSIDLDGNHKVDEAEFVAYGTRLYYDESYPAFKTPVGK